MKYIYLILILFSNLYSNIPNYLLNDNFQYDKEYLCSHIFNYNLKFEDKFLNRENFSNFDILDYDLYLDWSKILEGESNIITTREFKAIQKIKLKSLINNLDKILLDAVDLKIDSIFIDNIKTIFFKHLDNKIIEINLEKALNIQDSIELIIYYTYKNNVNRGLYLYPKGKIPWNDDSVNNLEKLAYTFSQPDDARYWMPCKDEPYDKALSRISVKVPKGFIVASNGLLDSIITLIEDGNEKDVYFWRNSLPISTYLMAVAASKYELYKDYYIRKNNPNDTVKIYNYVWKEDKEIYKDEKGSEFNAEKTLKRTPQMLEAYSNLFREYVYEKYGHAVIQPFYFGGMEHQTITFINRIWLTYNSELGLAHEVAHHWIGNLITCQTWQDIWINEGGATWFEALWIYYKTLKENNDEKTAFKEYNKYFTDRAWRYLSKDHLHKKIMNQIPTDQLFSNVDIIYTKASWIYHMLYRRLGDNFIDFMNMLFHKYQYRDISTDDFRKELKEFLKIRNIKFDSDKFMYQWVYDSGHPIYYTFLKYINYNNGKYLYRLTLEQVQKMIGLKELFQTDIKINFYKNGIIDTSIIVFNDLVKQDYEVLLNNIVDSLDVDRSFLLCNSWSNIVSVNDKNIKQFNYYSNNDINYININDLEPFTNLKIYDYLGNLRYHFNNQEYVISNIDLNRLDLASGIYFLVITSKNKTEIYKFIR